jgi:hypothetical protein
MENNQKLQSKLRIIQEFEQLVLEIPFKEITLEIIAQKSEQSLHGLLKVFPNKESILIAYFQNIQNTVFQNFRGIHDISEYTLQEKLQTFLEGYLDLFQKNEQFILKVFSIITHSPWNYFSSLHTFKEDFTAFLAVMLHEAGDKQEIPSPIPSIHRVTNFFWDYYLVIVTYWLRDKSPQHEQTTEFVDSSLALVSGLLESGLLTGASDLVNLLFSGHFMAIKNIIVENIDYTIHDLKEHFFKADLPLKNVLKTKNIRFLNKKKPS